MFKDKMISIEKTNALVRKYFQEIEEIHFESDPIPLFLELIGILAERNAKLERKVSLLEESLEDAFSK